MRAAMALGAFAGNDQIKTTGKIKLVKPAWRRHYNAIRPHASLGYKPPAREVFVPVFAAQPLRYVDRLRRPRWRHNQP